MVALAALLLSPGAATAAPASSRFASNGVRVHDQNGQPWNLSLVAERVADAQPYVSLEVTLARTKDPDGLPRGRQSHTWKFNLPASSMTVSADLASGSLDTGTQLGEYGRIDMQFDGAGSLEPTCGGHDARRSVTAAGSLRFDTQRPLFAAVTQRPSGGVLSRSDGQCFPSVTRCPPAGHVLSGAVNLGDGFRSFYVHERPGSDRATRTWNWVRYGTNGGPRITSTIREVAPAASVSVSADLSRGEVRGVSELYTSGALAIAAGGNYDDTAWANCGADRRFRYRTLTGRADGGLVADAHGFPNWTVPDSGMWASARQVLVEPR